MAGGVAEGGGVGTTREGEGAGGDGTRRGTLDDERAGRGEDTTGEVDIGPGVDRAPIKADIGIAEGLGVVSKDVTGEVNTSGEGSADQGGVATGGKGVGGLQVELSAVAGGVAQAPEEEGVGGDGSLKGGDAIAGDIEATGAEVGGAGDGETGAADAVVGGAGVDGEVGVGRGTVDRGQRELCINSHIDVGGSPQREGIGEASVDDGCGGSGESSCGKGGIGGGGAEGAKGDDLAENEVAGELEGGAAVDGCAGIGGAEGGDVGDCQGAGGDGGEAGIGVGGG